MGCIVLVRCVLVLRCGLAVVVRYPYAGFNLHTDTAQPHPYHNVTPTHIEPEKYNPWNNSTNKSQAPEDGCINIRNMLSIKWWNNKASDIKLASLFSTDVESFLAFVLIILCNELLGYFMQTLARTCITNTLTVCNISFLSQRLSFPHIWGIQDLLGGN